jgi:lipoate-protein ligase A
MSMSPTWLRLPLLRAPQSHHLALTEALLQSAAERPPLLYWQIAEPAALVLGIGESFSDLNIPACQQEDLLIYRRAAGGTAVLAGPDLLSLDVILPPGHPLAGRDIVEAYRWFGELWAATLQELGLPARTVPPAEAHAPRTRSALAQAGRLEHLLRQSCYGAISPYEVIVNGRKLVGLDQVRRKVGFLFQGGLLLRWEPAHLAALLTAMPEERPSLAEGLRARAAGLDELLSRAVSPDEIIARFEALVQERYGVIVENFAAPPAIEQLARTIEQEKYQPFGKKHLQKSDSSPLVFGGSPPDLWDANNPAKLDDQRPVIGLMAPFVGHHYSVEEIWQHHCYHTDVYPEEEAIQRPLAARIRAFDVPALAGATFTVKRLSEVAPALHALVCERLPGIPWGPLDFFLPGHLLGPIKKYGLIHTDFEAPVDETTQAPMVLELHGFLIEVNGQPSGRAPFRHLRLSAGETLEDVTFESLVFRLERATYANTDNPGIGVSFYD